ncbi:hypothetical protein [Amphritea japonica]|uniref:Uncharacterized protein n=1 Tax=Amphritea japonica ATCC BAA-1530 TaxID=1278309 RepID=A0A7R6P274_9GAMM|nr:hypothetical protein [Amphritea japonica]BBB25833.1 conserved hypothetical protein [Amphritea japonica ATCC BAA-1530]
MKNMVFTGVECDDRRIAGELQAMGYCESHTEESKSTFSKLLEAVGNFVTWMRWKGEVGVYGCRVAADHARFMESRVEA